ncbi:transcriptional regulator Myc-1 isoform X2 [Fundulus heteroclitus]|uniref:transcriptional regulator Myc-1 isoform X2 n=1 Tax=Fundulus heteroclitus TaxID=8078 RepID=UPI00165C3B82|nr:transcriptional regulator Myc-1 isoform X2 [Fundulus heteroclitus]
MVLMLAGSTWDQDWEQPCFFLDEEEDFYPPPPHRQLLPGPGEDIWKKFQLLPTPPASPSWAPPPPASPSRAPPPPSSPSRAPPPPDPPLLQEDQNPLLLRSFVIQDCMWSSSFADATKLERAVSQRLAQLRARRDPSGTGADPDPQLGRVNAEYLQDLQAAAAACVDPSEVFRVGPASEEPTWAEGTGSEPSLETPPLSSESEEEEEEEEEEEVDVVTVTRTPRRSGAEPLVLKRSHVDVEQHNYAAPRPAGKRAKMAAAVPVLGRRCRSPRSDGEDVDRRRSHNVLERQRRRELSTGFRALREQVPALAQNAKAPKVLILKRAAELVREVRLEERRLLREKDELTEQSRELRRRLDRLRTLRHRF